MPDVPVFSEDKAKRADLALAALDQVDAMVAYWDENQICRFANKAYYDWFGKTVDQMAGIALNELLGPLYVLNLPYIERACTGEKQVFEREITTPEGRVLSSLATYTPHFLDGKTVGFYANVVDVSQLKRLELELREAKLAAELQASHDFLTGLPNRAPLFNRISDALLRAKRDGSRVAGISLDLDDFKRVNDGHGHQAGDLFLIEIANRLKISVREVDAVTRMGGDEFFLLIQGIGTEAQVGALAGRILDEVRKPIVLAGVTFQPSCSMGIAVCLSDAMTPDQLIVESDQALLAAKKLGKGRYVFAELTTSKQG